MYVLSADEMKITDRGAINDYGIPSIILMEYAASYLYENIIDNHDIDDRILIVCGSGNNGADGLCLARQLKVSGYSPIVFSLGREKSLTDEGKIHLKSIINLGVEHHRISDESDKKLIEKFKKYSKISTVIVDAIFGISLNREVTGIYSEVIGYINNSKSKVLSVDIPSGISADSGKVMGIAVKADITFTFAYPKLGLYLYPAPEYVGELKICDIGIPTQTEKNLKSSVRIIDESSFDNLPCRNPNGHKGSFGKVLVIAGSSDMAGAAALATKSAYRMGSGLVYVFTENENKTAVLSYVPEAIVYGYSANSFIEKIKEKLTSLINSVESILIGSGMAENELSLEILKECIKSKKPLVVDAGALNLISQNKTMLKDLKERLNKTIITPHIGEMSRLLDVSAEQITDDLIKTARDFTRDYGIALCLKSARTVLCFPNGKTYLNIIGNDGMATAGSGDVLAGAILATLGEYGESFFEEASCKAVYFHSRAGDIASKMGGAYRIMAGDLIDKL